MEHLDGIVKLAEHELKAIVDNGKFRSREEIDSVYKLMDIIKDRMKIECMEEELEYPDEERSYEGRYAMGGRRYRSDYDDGMSYARGRRNAKRDSMGRYSREYRGYSSDGKEEYIEHLREMADDAPDEQTRQSIHRMIEQMK